MSPLHATKRLPFFLTLSLLANIGGLLGAFQGWGIGTQEETIYKTKNVIDTRSNPSNKIIAKEIKIFSKDAYVNVTNHGKVSFGAHFLNLNKYKKNMFWLGITFFLKHEGKPIIIDAHTKGKNFHKKMEVYTLKPNAEEKHQVPNLSFYTRHGPEQDAIIDAVNNKQEINYEIYLILKKDTVTTFDDIYQANKALFWIIITSIVVTLLGISTWIGWRIKKQRDKKKNPTTEAQDQITQKTAPQSKIKSASNDSPKRTISL